MELDNPLDGPFMDDGDEGEHTSGNGCPCCNCKCERKRKRRTRVRASSDSGYQLDTTSPLIFSTAASIGGVF